MRWRAAVGVAGMTFLAAAISAGTGLSANQVNIDSGQLEGTVNQDHTVRISRGIPFAAPPPVGDLRWKAPQPAPGWQGVRQADKFGSLLSEQQHLRRY